MKKTVIFTVLKIIGVLGIVCAAVGIVLVITGFGDFGTNNFMIGGFMTTFGLFIGFSCLMLGFGPEISKTSIQAQKYLQEENKDALKDIANTSAEINAEAVTTIAHAAAEGFARDTVFCKECGAKIDADSKFCRQCGTRQ
jgi:ribosomal protein L40E